MSVDQLRERVHCLAERLPWLGMVGDVAAMTASELEGAYRLLVRNLGG